MTIHEQRWDPQGEATSRLPLRWRKPRHVMVGSKADLFCYDVPFDFVDRVFAVMALCPRHTFQVLTKRPERMAEYLRTPDRFERRISDVAHDMDPDFCEPYVHTWPLPNVWLGTICEDQAAADERIPHLLRCPAAVRFLSCEPLLGAIRLPLFTDGGEDMGGDERREAGLPRTVIQTFGAPPGSKIDWVIVGGVSGPKARPCDVAWIRSIVTQCREAGVPCFVKQLGSHAIEGGRFADKTGPMCGVRLNDRKGGDPAEWPEDLRVRQWPKEAT